MDGGAVPGNTTAPDQAARTPFAGQFFSNGSVSSSGHLTSGSSPSRAEDAAAAAKAEPDSGVDDQQQPLLWGGSSDSSRQGNAHEEEASVSGQPEKFQIESDIDEASVIHRVNWHLLPIFFSLAMLCSIDRSNLSFAALQLNHDLHFSSAVYGLGSGIFFLGYALFAVPSTFVCAWVGAPRFLGGILVAWGCVATLFSCMRSQWQFYVLRFILGLAESGAYPGMWFQLALFYSERELGLAYSLVSTASSLSGVLGGPLAAAILKLDGALGLHGWQWLFVLEGFPAVMLGVVVLCFLAKTPATAGFLRQDEREWLVARKEAAAAQKQQGAKSAPDEEGEPRDAQAPTALGSLTTMLRSWHIWYLGCIWAIVSVGMDGLIFWIPLLITGILYGEVEGEFDDDSDEERVVLSGRAVHTALLSSIPFSSAAIGMVVIAYLAKRSGERHWHIAAPLLVAACAMTLMPLVEQYVTWLSFLALVVGAVGIWGPHGPLLSWPAALLPGTAAASGFALIKMLGSFAAFLGNFGIGELHEETGSFALPVFLIAGLMAFGALLTLLFKEPGHKGKMDVGPLISRLQDRIGMKRSRSDPATWYPKRTFSGSLSTIRENLPRPDHNIGGPRFDMPSIQTQLEVSQLHAEQSAVQHSLRAGPADPTLLRVI